MSRNVPNWWTDWGTAVRQEIVDKLQSGWKLESMPSFWRYKSYQDRCDVILHLRRTGELTKWQFDRLFMPAVQHMNPGGRYNEVQQNLYKVGEKGRGRILPPVYQRLEYVWLRANRQTIAPSDMNTGHLKNSMELLKESHCNAVAAMHLALGKLHTAFMHQPQLQATIAALYDVASNMEVDEFYPVFNALASEYAGREDAEVPIDYGIGVFSRDCYLSPEDDIDMQLNLGLDSWIGDH